MRRRFVTLAPLALAGTPALASPAFLSGAVSVSVYATGFNNPRGLKFGPDGVLYVAEGGPSLTTILGFAFDGRDRMFVLENTVGQPFPTPGYGDVVRIDPNGKKTVVVKDLPLPTGITFGPDGALYISIIGFGPPPSLPNGPGKVLRVTGL